MAAVAEMAHSVGNIHQFLAAPQSEYPASSAARMCEKLQVQFKYNCL